MGKIIKVNILDKNHSTGRGVGFYSEFLKGSIEKLSGFKLTNLDPDIIHYPYFDLFYHTLPNSFERPTVVTVHDLTPLVMPDRYPKGIMGTINLFRQWLSLRKVSAIITDSENSKRDICQHFFIEPEKIFVTPLAVDPAYKKTPTDKRLKEVRKKYGLPDQFILTVAGGPNPNKNLPSLAEITERLGIPLVIVGGGMLQEIKKPVHAELIDLVRLEVYNHLIKPGFVPTEDLVAIYHLARLYVQASFYEGFGLCLLEAMTAGCLVVSSSTSSLKEIYHERAITFNPRSLTSMEKAISKALNLTSSQKKKQLEQAREKSAEFTWSKTANLTSKIYKNII